ncbi:MAG: NAD-dependent epimerase/dehydratase family protein [Thermodesulfobacteriota bacterium]
MDKPVALVLGGTGLVGGLLVRRLLEEGRYRKVMLPVRRPVSGFNDPALDVRVLDFDRMGERRDAFEADHVFIALGTTMNKAGSKEAFYKVDYGYALEAARLCRENGAQKLVVISAGGAGKKSLIFYSRVKGELEEALSQLGYPSLAILRPSLILGDREEDRPGEEMAKSLSQRLSFLIPKRYKAIQAETIARAMAALASRDLPGMTIYENEQIESFS